MRSYEYQRPVFEDIYGQTGFGLYNKLLLGILSASAFSQAVAFMIIPFGLPLAACDLGFSTKVLINADMCLFLGMGLGGFILNCVVDAVGRSSMIHITLIIIFGSNFASGFAHGAQMLKMYAFALGCGLKANACCIKILLGESLHPNKRGFYMVFPDLFWTAGYIISTIGAWLINPYIISNTDADVRLATWRILYGLSAASSIMMACISALLQPSIRFLLLTQKYNDAIDCLKKLYTINNCKHRDTLEIESSSIKGIIHDYNIETNYRKINCYGIILEFLLQLKGRIALLFAKRFFAPTLALTFMQIPLMFGIFTANLWLSKTLNYNDYNNCHINGTDILHIDGGKYCKQPYKKNDPYPDFFFLAANVIVGQLILMCIVEKLGRRISLIFGYVTCGISSILLAFILRFYAIRLFLSSLFIAAFALLISAFSIILVELYPTTLRGTAAGFIYLISCVFAAFTMYYLQAPCQHPFIVVGSLMIAAAVTTFFLPEVSGKPMVE